jgi:antitoxin VapB
MKRRTVSDAALKAAGRRNTKASARLEGRELPADHVRSAAVERYLAMLAVRTRTGSETTEDAGCDIATTPGPSVQDDPRTGLLYVLATEIWPLLTDDNGLRR